MISQQSNPYFKFWDRIRYLKFKTFDKKNINKFIDLIKFGTLPRPHYALGLLLAAHEAANLGYKKISIIEFGCWNCDGLIDLEHYIKDIKNFFQIEFEVYGFDLGDGHPDYDSDPRDRLYELSKGDYPFDKKINLEKLEISELILGDVKNTITNFAKSRKIDNAPIGFISFDLGLYTSTKNALKLLEEDNKYFLPRTFLYFDNNYFVLDNEGDRLAVKEFNENNKKQICSINEMAEQLSLSWKKWLFLGSRIYTLSDQEHPKFNIHYEQTINIRINKKFTKTLI